MIRYPLTIFLSAFLLFQVQPLVGKVILPWFGGGPAVWTACMLFFQILLLGGYSYAHVVSGKLPPKVLAGVHAGLLLLSLAYLPVSPAESWKPNGAENPLLQILGLLAFTIGLPYFLLSTTGPLLQESFRRETGRIPYRLYSLSNIGSLLALLSYPFVFEPRLTLRAQSIAWSAGYLAFVLLGLWSTLQFVRVWSLAPLEESTDSAASTNLTVAGEPAATPPSWSRILLWMALAACGSVMLLATTNQLCQEVTSVPFLWVLPLSLYLLSFIICFDHERWYHRNTFVALLAVAVLFGAYAMLGRGMDVFSQLAVYSIVLFVCCMVCHGELVRSKPAPQYATLFYLMVSAGGAVGGLLVALVAPLVLRNYLEYPLGLIATVVLVLITSQSEAKNRIALPRHVWFFGIPLALGVMLAVGVIASRGGDRDRTILELTRNFYGVLRVQRDDYIANPNGAVVKLTHGSTEHGCQLLEPDKRRWPTTYYGKVSGVGLAIEHHPRRQAKDPSKRGLRIGVIGLGCGTLAAYGQAGDSIRFYEINPQVIRLANEYFTYLKDTPAKVDIVLGDARVNLQRELDETGPEKFDILAVDAFSSDAIPMHLLTRESVELYLNHLQPDGILCIHISNVILDLSGVVLGISQELNWPCVRISSGGDRSLATQTAEWVIITQNWQFLSDPILKENWSSCDMGRDPVLWTDDYGSLWQVLTQ